MADEVVVQPLSPVRKIIASRMVEAKQAIPHFRLVADLDVGALMAHRQVMRARRPDDPLSLNDLVVKASALALMAVPAMNIQMVDGKIHRYSSADISVVTALEDGLSTPVLRNADSKSVWEIAREIRELAARAAKNALRMDEILGGTFSVSNLGMFGVEQFDAIINAPQCSILAVGMATPRCVAGADGLPSVGQRMTVTLSADHRAIDGALAARFLRALRGYLEQPEQLG